MPPRKEFHRSSDAIETAATSKSGDEQGPKKSPSFGRRSSFASVRRVEPLALSFATFTEWASEADEAAYSDL